jgi:KUP system potassium uptake protein
MTIVPDGSKGMARWRKRLFTTMARNAASPADFFNLPSDRVVTTGSHIAL